MPGLSVENIPEDLLDRLRRRAERNHRSLQDEVMCILEEAAAEEGELSLRELRAHIDELGLRTLGEATQIVREDRDRR